MAIYFDPYILLLTTQFSKCGVTVLAENSCCGSRCQMGSSGGSVLHGTVIDSYRQMLCIGVRTRLSGGCRQGFRSTVSPLCPFLISPDAILQKHLWNCEAWLYLVVVPRVGVRPRLVPEGGEDLEVSKRYVALPVRPFSLYVEQHVQDSSWFALPSELTLPGLKGLRILVLMVEALHHPVVPSAVHGLDPVNSSTSQSIYPGSLTQCPYPGHSFADTAVPWSSYDHIHLHCCLHPSLTQQFLEESTIMLVFPRHL